jgi:hypothetical protein
MWDDKIRKRFWAKVEMHQPDECWIWLGSANRDGYGMFNPLRGWTWNAHRFSYALVYGITDVRNDIHHTCNNRLCVNFHHLEEISHKENVKQQNRVLNIFCKNGHERTEKNIRIGKDGKRNCRICDRDRARNRRR